MNLGVRPMTFNTNPDGSTKWIFVQLSGFNGFAVVDFATQMEIRRIKNPDLPPGKKTVPEGSDPSHGMAVTSDGKTLVVCSRLNNFLYSYSLPDLKPLGGAERGGKGAGWVTLTPDGKTAYVANPVTNDVSVVDIVSMKEVTRIPVGFVPKRNVTAVLQYRKCRTGSARRRSRVSRPQHAHRVAGGARARGPGTQGERRGVARRRT
jgi:YVTN family beta-propeller protein